MSSRFVTCHPNLLWRIGSSTRVLGALKIGGGGDVERVYENSSKTMSLFLTLLFKLAFIEKPRSLFIELRLVSKFKRRRATLLRHRHTEGHRGHAVKVLVPYFSPITLSRWGNSFQAMGSGEAYQREDQSASVNFISSLRTCPVSNRIPQNIKRRVVHLHRCTQLV